MAEREHRRIYIICCEREITDLLDTLLGPDSGEQEYELTCTQCDVCLRNSESAVARVQSYAPDLIIVNQPVRPTHDCGKIVAALAAEPTMREIPVIVIETGERSYLLGLSPIGEPPNVVAIFGKPFDVNALTARIREILGSSRAK